MAWDNFLTVGPILFRPNKNTIYERAQDNPGCPTQKALLLPSFFFIYFLAAPSLFVFPFPNSPTLMERKFTPPPTGSLV